MHKSFSRTEFLVDNVAESVVNRKIYHKIATTTCPRVSQILTIYTRCGVSLSVGIEHTTCTESAVYCVANGVVHHNIDIQTAVATINGVAVELTVEACTAVLKSVGVEHCPCTQGAVNGVADCVTHGEVDKQTAEASCNGIAVELSVKSGATVMPAICIDGVAGTDRASESVAKGVVDIKINNKVAIAAVYSVAQILFVFARKVIGRVIASVYRHATKVSVGVERSTGTYSLADSVAQGVVHIQIDVQTGIATRNSIAVKLSVKSSIAILNAVGIENRACTDRAVNSVADGIVNSEVDIQTSETSRRGIAEILSVETRMAVLHAVGIQYCSSADSATESVANGVVDSEVYHQIAETASDGVA